MPSLRLLMTPVLLLTMALATPCGPGPSGTPSPTPSAATPSNGATTAPDGTAAPTAPPQGTPTALTPTAPAPTAQPTPAPTPEPTPFPAPSHGGLKEATNAACANGVDDDGNSYTDCADNGCKYTVSVTACPGGDAREGTDAACSNGKDDDGDGYKDCADYDCFWSGDVGVCDRDGDGFTPDAGDCYDHPTLPFSPVVHPGVPEMCGDGEDDDCDGIAEETPCTQLHLGSYFVDYALDGDTVQIQGLGRARLLGIDTPETGTAEGSTAECYGAEAKAYTTALLEDQPVDVWLDPYSQADDFHDLYGRWLTHVYRRDGTYHNGDLVRGGFACVFEDSFPTVHTPELSALLDAAQDAGAGLWTACAPDAERVCF